MDEVATSYHEAVQYASSGILRICRWCQFTGLPDYHNAALDGEQAASRCGCRCVGLDIDGPPLGEVLYTLCWPSLSKSMPAT